MATIDLTPAVLELRGALRRRVVQRPRGFRLGIVVEADNPAGASFARSLEREAAEAGVDVERVQTPRHQPERTLLALDRLVVDPRIDGIVIMQPVLDLPPAVIAAHLPASKDVEAVTPNARALAADGLHRSTPVAEACLVALEHLEIDPTRARILVVGHGPSGGRPIAQRLLAAGAQVSIVQRDIGEVVPLPPYDVLISAVGAAGVIPPGAVLPGTTVLDVGTSFVAGRLVGDVGPEAAARAGRVTPVPGGIGRLTAVCALVALTELHSRRPGPLAAWSLLETLARIVSPADPAGGAALAAVTGALAAALDGLCRMHDAAGSIGDSGALAVRLLLAADRDRDALSAYRAARRRADGSADGAGRERLALTRQAAEQAPGEIGLLLDELVERLERLVTTPALELDRRLGLRLAQAARDAVQEVSSGSPAPSG
ncbi:MAG TPA: bifunctional 5,10-methylenetetrahydrofolate dehydrogenase/5,10-methenyltetrahydrofolate cyclohydrolase [Verrucomicrobiae bacterium]|nr:bifunctional 5,10-methylenetetrahydrofolate dehydrogenase/5,10-methenyltetrahydrofolate cyclohydrolase [Verrucomicrobiae bacterium]